MPPTHFSKQKGLQNLILLGRVRSLISGLSEPAHCQQFSTHRSCVFLLKHTGSFPDICRGTVNPGQAISTLGILSRAFSVASASGSSSELYKYRSQCSHTESSSQDICLVPSGNSMAACSSFPGGVKFCTGHRNGQSLRNYQKHHIQMVFDISNRMASLKCCNRFTGNMKDRHQHSNNMLYRYFWSNTPESAWNLNPSVDPEIEGFHSSSSSSYAAGAAPDVSFDGSVREDQQEKNTSSHDQKALGDRTLKLLSGSCYLPHPDKEETGGEDAHFICVDEQAIGVADGVGGWADLGVDAGQYARELMSNSVDAIKEEPKGSVDPSRVLEKAYSSTKARGSSTACIVALTDQGIHAVNLGDSGFIVVRDGCTIFRSPIQQHDFNFTYQLESGHGSDLPSSAQVFTFSVAPGDVLVAGTDGLFDNLYNNEVTAVVVHAVRAGLGPQVTAQKIAALARERARDKNRQTPFSTAAQDAGYRYYGGKLDDITVVVSYITAFSP